MISGLTENFMKEKGYIQQNRLTSNLKVYIVQIRRQQRCKVEHFFFFHLHKQTYKVAWSCL